MSTRIKLGVLRVAEPFESTQYHPYAAHYTVHSVQPGEYPVYVTLNGSLSWLDSVVTGVDTVITGADWEHSDSVGKVSSHTVRVYAYMMPDVLADGPAVSAPFVGGVFHPAPGVGFRADFSLNDGKRYGTSPVLAPDSVVEWIDDQQNARGKGQWLPIPEPRRGEIVRALRRS